jgi:hypothetical protein
MKFSDAGNELQRLLRALLALITLPAVRLHFHTCIAPHRIAATYALFTRPHARFRLIKNKTLGIALIDLSKFKSPADYLATVKRKDYAGHHAKIARKRGYTVREFRRSDHVDEIHAIHTSSSARQGRPMDMSYQSRQTEFDEGAPLRCFGVFHRDGRLVGYCSFGIYGNFAATDKIIGIRNKDGAMYLLLLEILSFLIAQTTLDFFMYDTYLGAREGLRSFKQRIGFQPYRVRYAIT